VISPGAALKDVAQTTKVRAMFEGDISLARERQAEAIRQALHAGAAVVDIAAAANLTPARIYQIRDGVR
jgi:2,4-dienoyl-CoA reductase-like NADH-dependent reductase (Old Yellow Enzyme family)